ncbi:hypothetical protein [Microbacterium sp. bgisy189]|uniref:hypothetical protein n=1 Tax=Microbacterium sp. bgisy189 TaxID=3413798 RepID=UPI003EC0259F
MTTPPVSVTAQRAWGVVAVIVACLSIVPGIAVLALTATVDENFVWFLFAALPIAILGGALAAVLGIVGLVIAFTRKAGYVWPIVGTVLGLIVAIALFIWASG